MFDWNWLINVPYSNDSQIISDSIVSGWVNCKNAIQYFIYTGVIF